MELYQCSTWYSGYAFGGTNTDAAERFSVVADLPFQPYTYCITDESGRDSGIAVYMALGRFVINHQSETV